MSRPHCYGLLGYCGPRRDNPRLDELDTSGSIYNTGERPRKVPWTRADHEAWLVEWQAVTEAVIRAELGGDG